MASASRGLRRAWLARNKTRLIGRGQDLFLGERLNEAELDPAREGTLGTHGREREPLENQVLLVESEQLVVVLAPRRLFGRRVIGEIGRWLMQVHHLHLEPRRLHQHLDGRRLADVGDGDETHPHPVKLLNDLLRIDSVFVSEETVRETLLRHHRNTAGFGAVIRALGTGGVLRRQVLAAAGRRLHHPENDVLIGASGRVDQVERAAEFIFAFLRDGALVVGDMVCPGNRRRRCWMAR